MTSVTAFAAVSYNILATAYVHRSRYPNTADAILDPAWRTPAVVKHIVAMEADLLCLQEVEPAVFEALQAALAAQGFAGEYARKLGKRPEGLAVFFRLSRFTLADARVMPGRDARGQADNTGHVTQLVVLRHGERTLGVINTHLAWDPPEAPVADRRGLRQAQQFLGEHRRRAAECDGWIISGDFNVEPGSDTIAAVRQAGFRFAHQDLAGVFTCNAHGVARLVDYLFVSDRLRGEAVMPRQIDGGTVLPSVEEPSDHLALMAHIEWRPGVEPTAPGSGSAI